MTVNQVSAALIGLVAVSAFAATWTFDPVPPGLPGLGAVEFPRLLCGLLLALALLLAFEKPKVVAPEDAEPPAPRIDARGWLIFACCLAFLPVMAVIGLLGACAVFLVVVGRLWGETRWFMLLAVAVGFTLSAWLVFIKIFRLTLPDGVVGQMLFGV
ncbi:tripartite tricarboxylate transporter TctB family protein [Falsiroseomonas sp.]|uniref:tripartite tricarboxylate transporter TctB family protein n=1 Tax=Falsiroseomonas sp. TaxID=2870721 RepID=UPI003F72902D